MSGSLGFGSSKQNSAAVQQSGAASSSAAGQNAWASQGNQAVSTQGNQAASNQDIWGNQQGALTDLYAQAQQLMGGGSSYGQQAANVGQQGQNAWQQQLTPGANPYFDQAVQASIDQATQSFKTGTLADLDARSAGVGQLGSSRDRLAAGEAAGQFGQSIAQTSAQQRAQQYSADQDRSLQAIGMTGNMQQSAYSPLSVAASLIGGPTALTNSQSVGWGNSQSDGWGNSQSNGWSNSNSGQWGTGVSNGSGNGWNVNSSGGLKSSS